MLRMNSEKEKLKTERNEYKVNEDTLKAEIKELKEEKAVLKEKVKMLQRVVEVDNQLKMCRYIWESTTIEADDLVEQYLQTLLYCKVIKQKDYEEIKTPKHMVDDLHEEDTHENVVNIFSQVAMSEETESQEEQYIDVDEDKIEEISVEDIDEMLGFDEE